MVAYEFYRCDAKGEKHFIWILPERRKNSERVTRESIINWGRKVIVDDTEAKNMFFTRVEIDEAQIESQRRIRLSELRKKCKKSAFSQFSRG
jgi:hypothetical protein